MTQDRKSKYPRCSTCAALIERFWPKMLETADGRAQAEVLACHAPCTRCQDKHGRVFVCRVCTGFKKFAGLEGRWFDANNEFETVTDPAIVQAIRDARTVRHPIKSRAHREGAGHGDGTYRDHSGLPSRRRAMESDLEPSVRPAATPKQRAIAILLRAERAGGPRLSNAEIARRVGDTTPAYVGQMRSYFESDGRSWHDRMDEDDYIRDEPVEKLSGTQLARRKQLDQEDEDDFIRHQPLTKLSATQIARRKQLDQEDEDEFIRDQPLTKLDSGQLARRRELDALDRKTARKLDPKKRRRRRV